MAACSEVMESGQQNAVPSAHTAHVVPNHDWSVEPSNDFDALHPIYTIVNDRLTTLAWQARTTEKWLTAFEMASGELEPGESLDIMFEINLESVLEGGSANIEFVDRESDSEFGQRTVTIEATAGGEAPGWTMLASSGDSQTVYVSSSTGDDNNDGLSPEYPKRTIAAGRDALRHGKPDWLLLRRGDAWQEGLGQWKKSGRSANEPMVISTYGDDPARPLLRTGNVSGVWTNGSGGTPSRIENLAIVGLHFWANGYTGNGNCVGAQWLQPSTNILFEDCYFQAYSTNLVVQGMGGRHKDFSVRRSVIVDAYSVHDSGDHPQGLYAYGVDGLLIEENVFDHNGWNEDVPNAGADIFSHNLYVDNSNTDVVVRGNIIAHGGSHGMQLRPGGVVLNNLFLRNSIALSLGGGNNPEPGGVTADVRGNVFWDGKDIDSANPRGWGIWFGNIKSGRVAYNVIANNTTGTFPVALSFDGEHVGDSQSSIGIHHLVIEKNVVANWGGSIIFSGNSHQLSHITLINNQFQDEVAPDPLLWHSVATSTSSIESSDNLFHCPLVPSASWTHIGPQAHTLQYWMTEVGDTTSKVEEVHYVDPDRSPATYSDFTGEVASESVFLDRIREQSRMNWRPEFLAGSVNRYLRAGFQPTQP
jgi:hypothetical protein